jgi:perosamine synthetase
MIPLYKPYMPELPELNHILYSGALAYGVYTREFEDALRNFLGSESVITTSSFNMAISVVCSVLDARFDDEVIASPMACLASTQPYASSGLKIVWADVDPATGTLDPESVKKSITSRTKMIVHNHFCGYPGYVDEINAIGREYGVPVVDDGIECFGSEYKDRIIGVSGADAAVFSFNAVRIPNTIDGGAVVFRNRDLYEKSLLARDCGIDRSKFRDELGEISPKCDIKTIGFSATMSNLNGYIGLQQMKHVPEILEAQRLQAQKWDEYFAESREGVPLRRDFQNPNYWVYGILSDNKRETIVKFREKGFYASGVHIKNNVYSVFGRNALTSLNGVDDFYRRFVALPCGWWMDERFQ